MPRVAGEQPGERWAIPTTRSCQDLLEHGRVDSTFAGRTEKDDLTALVVQAAPVPARPRSKATAE